MNAPEIKKLAGRLAWKIMNEEDYWRWIETHFGKKFHPTNDCVVVDYLLHSMCLGAIMRLEAVLTNHKFLVDPPEQVKLAMADLALTHDLSDEIIEAIKAEEYSKVCFLLKNKKDANQTATRLKRNALLIYSVIKNIKNPT